MERKEVGSQYVILNNVTAITAVIKQLGIIFYRPEYQITTPNWVVEVVDTLNFDYIKIQHLAITN